MPVLSVSPAAGCLVERHCDLQASAERSSAGRQGHPTGAGGAGGTGYALNSGAAPGVGGLADQGGGGGGGGGGGYVQSNHALTDATVSPAANVVP